MNDFGDMNIHNGYMNIHKIASLYVSDVILLVTNSWAKIQRKVFKKNRNDEIRQPCRHLNASNIYESKIYLA